MFKFKNLIDIWVIIVPIGQKWSHNFVSSLYTLLVFFLEISIIDGVRGLADYVGQCRFGWFLIYDNYMNRPEKLLSADNCSHYKTMGWVTPCFSVHMTREISCQLPRNWSSIDSTVGDLPYNWLRVGFKGLRFSSAAEYRPIL